MEIMLADMLVRILVYYLITSLAAGLLVVFQPYTGLSPEVLVLAQFAPTLGVLAVMMVFRKVKLAAGLSLEPFVLLRIVLCLSAVLIFFGLVAAGYALAGRDVTFIQSAALAYPLALLVVTLLIGAAAEELGWRAYLQPELETRFSPLVSSVMVGLLWGLWHPAYFAQGLGFGGLFIVSSVALSIILGQLLVGARGNNLLIATLFHAAVNLGLLLLFDEEQGDLFSITVLAASSCLVAAFALVVTRQRFRLRSF